MLKRFLITIILFVFQTVTYAGSSTDTLNQLLRNIRSMRADFIQTLMDNNGKMIQQSWGKMALQRPGQFRWETKRPNEQLIVANGSRLWIYDPDLQQVVVR